MSWNPRCFLQIQISQRVLHQAPPLPILEDPKQLAEHMANHAVTSLGSELSRSLFLRDSKEYIFCMFLPDSLHKMLSKHHAVWIPFWNGKCKLVSDSMRVRVWCLWGPCFRDMAKLISWNLSTGGCNGAARINH